MDYHQNARLTVFSREQMCRKVVVEGLTLKLAAASFNVSAKTAAKWVLRYRRAGGAGSIRRSGYRCPSNHLAVAGGEQNITAHFAA